MNNRLTSIQLKNNLSKKDYRTLSNLTRLISPWPKSAVERITPSQLSDMFIEARRHFSIAKKIIALYEKAKVDNDSMMSHWSSNRVLHYYNNTKYKLMPKNERKDNKTYINYGSGGGSHSIRYPRKKRKTAWKRFYKLFPKLKPINETKSPNT